MNKKSKLIYIWIISILLVLPMVSSLFNMDSPNYNRSSISALPKLILSNEFDLRFTEKFDQYYTQNFNLRSLFVSLYHQTSIILFKETGNNQVLLGDNSMLFFKETLNDFQRTSTLSVHDIERLNEVFRIIQLYTSSKAIESYFFVAPNKATIYPEYFPDNYQVFENKSNLEMLLESSLQLPFINVKNALLDHKDIYQEVIYHKKDSHWNQLGAYIAYQEILSEMGLTPLSFDESKLEKEVSWHGDLSVMLYPAFRDLDIQYNLGIEETFIFTRPIRQFDDMQIESRNEHMSNSIVMFRDSFANALIPLISNSFESAHYFRNFPYDFRLLESINPDYLLLEIAERNIPWLLQTTPILLSQPQDQSVFTSKSKSIPVTVHSKKMSDMIFINGLFDTTTIANEITAVKLLYQGIEYDAFPIYQDDNFQDRVIYPGFSAYLDASINVSDLSILVRIHNEWFIIE